MQSHVLGAFDAKRLVAFPPERDAPPRKATSLSGYRGARDACGAVREADLLSRLVTLVSVVSLVAGRSLLPGRAFIGVIALVVSLVAAWAFVGLLVLLVLALLGCGLGFLGRVGLLAPLVARIRLAGLVLGVASVEASVT